MRTIKIIKSSGSVMSSDTILATVRMWLGDIMNGEYVLTLTKTQKPRTNQQNKLMWVWFGCIAKNWSEATDRMFTAQDVHDAYATMFLPIDTPRGRIAGHTSRLTSEQMSEFMNRVQADAASEYGIKLPNPEDMYFEIWAQEYNY